MHIPYCKSKCAYCAFVSGCDFDTQERYVRSLLREIRCFSGKNIVADTVYIGGGTPSCLYRGGIESIISAIRDSFCVSADAEITVEANPESCDVSFSDEIKSAGVNRVSIGLQSANDDVLAKIGRIHTKADFVKAVDVLQCKGIDNISSDIILGLPGETRNDVESGIELLSRCCAHISMYALSVEEGTPLYTSGYLPDDDITADMYEFACNLLENKGFFRYEVSNFAKIGKESKHNRKYWTMQPYIGIGVAAHGYDGKRTRYYHADVMTNYLTDGGVVEVKLSESDLYNEYIMLALRTERGIDESDFASRFGYSFFDRNAEMAEKYIKLGVVERNGGRIRIAPNKMFVMNGIIEDFMLD